MTPLLQSSLDEARMEGRQEGMQKGRQEGMQKGVQKGRQEGRQEGVQKGMKAVALNMLKKKADIFYISEMTGLSTQEIKKLKK